MVVKPHGVRGMVKVRLYNPSSELLAGRAEVWVEAGDGRTHGIETVHGASPAGALLSLEGVTDRGRAELLRGARLMARREAVALDEDQYLYADLIGCAVRLGPPARDAACDMEPPRPGSTSAEQEGVTASERRSIGQVVEVFEAGASDVLVVRRDDGSELMLPMVDDWVVEVDLGHREILVAADVEARWSDDG